MYLFCYKSYLRSSEEEIIFYYMETAHTYLSKWSEMAIGYAPRVLLALLTLVIGFWIINRVVHMLSLTLQRRNFDVTLERFVASLVSVGLKVMLLLSVAGMFGIQTTSFIAIFTALAFAVGTALSGSLAHFASGVLLQVFRPYKVGDLVNLAGQTGNVEEIGVFNTTLLTPDNKRIIIPNGMVTSNIMTNISGQGEIRVDMLYNVAGNASIDQARAVIQRVADSCPQVLKDRPTDIFVNQLPTGMIEMWVRPWCKSEHYWDTYFYMQENIKKELDKAGVPFPKPAMDVHNV